VKLIISLALWVYDSARGAICHSLGYKQPATCVILCYHSVGAAEKTHFARQMDQLLRTASPIHIETKPDMKDGRHYAGISFDDGFRCVVENALPELEKRNIPAVLFVPVGYLGFTAGWLKNNPGGAETITVLSAGQLRELRTRRLVSFGSHCVTHPNLLTLKDSEAMNEIVASKEQLEQITGRIITLLSFPYGAFDARHTEIARAAGYKRVFSIEPRLAFSLPEEYITGRVTVDLTDWGLEFRLKLLGAYRWHPMASQLKRKVRAVLFGIRRG
jgi:peptidoglycan/xylan/chitin deacetylase (PgdA/CDA1 family)